MRPATLYGACKAALHLSTASYFSERGISHSWGHVFYLYGPGEHPSRLVPSVIRTLAKGERFACKHPSDVRDYLHVEDVASAFVAILGSEVEGDVNIASGEPITVGNLVTTVARVMGRPDLVDCDPSIPEASRIVADNARLRNEAGWKPRFSGGDGLADTVRWCQKSNLASESKLNEHGRL